MKKILKTVLISLFILSMNAFGMIIDTRFPEASYELNESNIIYTRGLDSPNGDFILWESAIKENGGYIDPYQLTNYLRFTYDIDFRNTINVSNSGNFADFIREVESILEIKTNFRLNISAVQKSGKPFKRAIQYKLIDDEGKIIMIFSIRNIELLEEGHISWDLDSMGLVINEEMVGPQAFLFFMANMEQIIRNLTGKGIWLREL